MRPVINVTTRKDGDKEQIITNFNNDQKSLLFLKLLFIKSTWHQIRPYLRKNYRIVH